MRTNLLFWFCGIRGCGGAAGVRRTAAAFAAAAACPSGTAALFAPAGRKRAPHRPKQLFSPAVSRTQTPWLPFGEARGIMHGAALSYRWGCIRFPAARDGKQSPTVGVCDRRKITNGRPMAAPTGGVICLCFLSSLFPFDEGGDICAANGEKRTISVCLWHTHNNCARKAQFHNGISHYFTSS